MWSGPLKSYNITKLRRSGLVEYGAYENVSAWFVKYSSHQLFRIEQARGESNRFCVDQYQLAEVENPFWSSLGYNFGHRERGKIDDPDS